MFSSVNPQTFHRFLAPDRRTVIVLTWRRPPVPWKQRLRTAIMGGEDPTSPRHAVSAGAFGTAVSLLDGGDVTGALQAFRRLGYDVTTDDMELAP